MNGCNYLQEGENQPENKTKGGQKFDNVKQLSSFGISCCTDTKQVRIEFHIVSHSM